MTIQDAETTETININTRNSCLTQIFSDAGIAQYSSYYAGWISIIQKISSNNYFKVDKQRISNKMVNEILILLVSFLRFIIEKNTR